MKIILEIKENNDIILSLFEGKLQKDSLKWCDENNLSRLLLANLDKLLRKNGLGVDPVKNSRKKKLKSSCRRKISNGIDKIREYKIISEVPQKWTTYRIADIAFKSLILAKKKALC